MRGKHRYEVLRGGLHAWLDGHIRGLRTDEWSTRHQQYCTVPTNQRVFKCGKNVFEEPLQRVHSGRHMNIHHRRPNSS